MILASLPPTSNVPPGLGQWGPPAAALLPAAHATHGVISQLLVEIDPINLKRVGAAHTTLALKWIHHQFLYSCQAVAWEWSIEMIAAPTCTAGSAVRVRGRAHLVDGSREASRASTFQMLQQAGLI